MNSNEEIDRKIAREIHYPECWDEMAYPTLSSALFEMMGEFECSSCKENVEHDKDEKVNENGHGQKALLVDKDSSLGKMWKDEEDFA